MLSCILSLLLFLVGLAQGYSLSKAELHKKDIEIQDSHDVIDEYDTAFKIKDKRIRELEIEVGKLRHSSIAVLSQDQ